MRAAVGGAKRQLWPHELERLVKRLTDLASPISVPHGSVATILVPSPGNSRPEFVQARGRERADVIGAGFKPRQVFGGAGDSAFLRSRALELFGRRV